MNAKPIYRSKTPKPSKTSRGWYHTNTLIQPNITQPAYLTFLDASPPTHFDAKSSK